MLKKTPNRVIAVNIICMGLINGISTIMMPVYSYLLGSENYGLASIYITWATVLSTIIGLQMAASIAVAQKDFAQNEQLAYQANGVYLAVLMSASIFVVIGVFSAPIASLLELPRWSILLLCPHAFGLFCVNVLNSKFTYEFKQEKNLLVSVTMSIGAAIISVIVILSLPSDMRYFGKVVGGAIPQILCGLLLLAVMLKRVGPHMQWRYTKYMAAYGMPLVFSSLCLQLFSSSDKLMLQKMDSNSAVGIYALAFNFAAIISSIWTALNHAWGPFYYQYEKIGNDEELLLHAKNYIRLFSVATIGFVLLAPEVFQWFSAPEFWSGKKIIPIFVIGFYANFLGCFARNHQYYYKKTKTIAGISVGTSVFNLIANFVLIPFWGAMGAAMATMLSQLISVFLSWWTAKYFTVSYRKYPYSIKLFWPYLAMIVIAVMLFYLDNSWPLRWVLGGCLGIWMAKKLWKTKQIF